LGNGEIDLLCSGVPYLEYGCFCKITDIAKFYFFYEPETTISSSDSSNSVTLLTYAF
jgi:hypothetical protein